MGRTSQLIFVGVCIVIAFLAGHCSRKTGPREDHKRIIDSLNRAYVQLAARTELKYKRRADSLFKSVQIPTKRKIVQQRASSAALASNLSLPKRAQDSLAKQELSVPQADSSRFSLPAVRSILTLGSRIRDLLFNSMQDSTIIGNLTGAYYAQDSTIQNKDALLYNRKQALNEKDEQIAELKVDAKKVKWWQWPLVGIAFVAGVILSAL